MIILACNYFLLALCVCVCVCFKDICSSCLQFFKNICLFDLQKVFLCYVFCCIDLLESFFIFCVATMFCFIRDLQSFFLHILYTPFTFIRLRLFLVVFFCCFNTIHCHGFFLHHDQFHFILQLFFISQFFLLTTSYILLYNYFYITIYHVYCWFYLACDSFYIIVFTFDQIASWLFLFIYSLFFPHIVLMVYFFVCLMCASLFLDFYFFPLRKDQHIGCNSKVQLTFSNIIKYFFLF